MKSVGGGRLLERVQFAPPQYVGRGAPPPFRAGLLRGEKKKILAPTPPAGATFSFCILSKRAAHSRARRGGEAAGAPFGRTSALPGAAVHPSASENGGKKK